jgi:hypothetical protein
MNPQPSLMISTDEFIFHYIEVGFIRKNFQRKYPAAMSNFIDRVRELMKAIQVRSKTKLFYNANRYYPENSARYHISETLTSQSHSGQRMYIAIVPVEASKKASIDAANKDPNAGQTMHDLIEELRELTQVVDDVYRDAKTHTGVSMSFVVEQILNFVTASKEDAAVQYCEINLGPQSVVSIDLSHRASISHYLQIRFDFSTPTTV